ASDERLGGGSRGRRVPMSRMYKALEACNAVTRPPGRDGGQGQCSSPPSGPPPPVLLQCPEGPAGGAPNRYTRLPMRTCAGNISCGSGWRQPSTRLLLALPEDMSAGQRQGTTERARAR